MEDSMRRRAVVLFGLILMLAGRAGAQEAEINLRGSIPAAVLSAPAFPAPVDGLITPSTVARQVAPVAFQPRTQAPGQHGRIPGRPHNRFQISPPVRVGLPQQRARPRRVLLRQVWLLQRDELAGLDIFDPDAPGPGPGVVTDLNFSQAFFQGEFAAGSHLSVFAELPVRWIQPQAFAAPRRVRLTTRAALATFGPD